jgi:hypothetical protein
MSKLNQVLLLAGLLVVGGVCYYRYSSGSTLGYVGGYIEGNRTGYDSGYREGFYSGYEDGYDSGFEIGREEGFSDGYAIGYEEGFSDGEICGYEDGFNEGNFTGCTDGYKSGMSSGSSGYDLRDPTYEEALMFIESDDTDELYDSDTGISSYYLLDYIRRNAHNSGYRIFWVQVDTYEGGIRYFCCFNTLDKGYLYFSFHYDLILEIEVGEPLYDRDIWVEPTYDDTVTEIEYIP